MQTRVIRVNDVKIGGNNPLVLIAGPCVIESEQHAIRHAEALKDIAFRARIPFIFKSSYDKANRSSIGSYRGVGFKKGIKILEKIRRDLNVPVISDVHSKEEVKIAAKVLDIIQIPALLSRQTDLIVEAARTKRIINVKKGQFMAPEDMENVIEKIKSAGNNNILLTERGSCFGYHNLVSDLRSLPIMRGFGFPVIYDATHSVQMPASLGKSSGGMRIFVPGLVRAAVGMGCDGIFLEVHENPDKAPCDGPNMLPIKELYSLLKDVIMMDGIVRKYER